MVIAALVMTFVGSMIFAAGVMLLILARSFEAIRIPAEPVHGFEVLPVLQHQTIADDPPNPPSAG